MVLNDIKTYVEQVVLPMYKNFDEGHDLRHVNNVIAAAFKMAEDYSVDENMLYVICACHDVGLKSGRELHHIYSAQYIRNNAKFKEWFSTEQIEVMAQAAEDHRASGKNEPRSIYGKIVADADREFTLERLIYRTVSYGKKNFPQYSDEQQICRVYDHCLNKYGRNGYMHFHLKNKNTDREIKRLYDLLDNKEEFIEECKKYL